MRRWIAHAAVILALFVAGCAAVKAGGPIDEISADRSERLSGVALGSVSDASYLHIGYPWVPAIGLCRRWKDGRDLGNVFLARVVLAARPFGFERLVVSENGVERTLPGRVLHESSRFGLYEPRYTEQLEVELSDDDVRSFVAAGASLELRMEGKDMWIKVPPGAALESALRDYRDHFVPPGGAN